MRSSRAEWLLLPLFLLPVCVAAGFLLVARAEYRREVSPFRTDGERLVREWLADGERADWLLRRFEERYSPVEGDGVPFRLDGDAGLVRGIRSEDEWVFTREFPVGLAPAALADRQVRLAVETGTAPARTEGADPATRAFGELLDDPDLEALRVAVLPASTKRYLLARWARRGVAPAGAEEALRVIDAVRRFAAAPDRARGPGVGEWDGITVLAAPGAWPVQLLPGRTAAGAGPEIPVAENGDGTVRLLWSPGAAGNAAWEGRLEEPVAGAYSFVLPLGGRWWDTPFFLRWIGPVVGACLLLLVLPAALFVSLRRRRRLDEARARFINELAHDLRTPLTSLRLYAEMLAAGKTPEEERPRYVETMARESGRLSALLANLLDLSRLERGAREYASERLALDAIVERALADFAALHPARADDVRVAGPDDVTVLADPTALARVFDNLLDNAGKFTDAGTPIRVAWDEPAGGEVRIRVEDDGPGIPAEERSRLFRRYERGDRAKADGVPGTGLGLALVRELVEGMGGRVRLMPYERGCRFEITLPGGDDE